MIVGIISDSHDNMPMIRAAVERFNAAGAGLVLHAGDFVAPFSLVPLGQLACPFRGIFGNNDGEKVGLKLKAADLGGEIVEPPLVVESGGRRILMLHDCKDPSEAAKRHSADILIFGHTHEVLRERPAKGDLPLFINPGECGGWLTGKCTIALLDTATLAVRLIDLSSPAEIQEL